MSGETYTLVTDRHALSRVTLDEWVLRMIPLGAATPHIGDPSTRLRFFRCSSREAAVTWARVWLHLQDRAEQPDQAVFLSETARADWAEELPEPGGPYRFMVMDDKHLHRRFVIGPDLAITALPDSLSDEQALSVARQMIHRREV